MLTFYIAFSIICSILFYGIMFGSLCPVDRDRQMSGVCMVLTILICGTCSIIGGVFMSTFSHWFACAPLFPLLISYLGTGFAQDGIKLTWRDEN